MRVRRLSRVVTRIFDGALRPLGITPAQLSLLVIIELQGPVAPSVVGRFLDIEKSTLSRNLRLMNEAGWIHEKAEGQEKRLELTVSGRKILAEAYPLWRAAQKKASNTLGTKATVALNSSDK